MDVIINLLKVIKISNQILLGNLNFNKKISSFTSSVIGF